MPTNRTESYVFQGSFARGDRLLHLAVAFVAGARPSPKYAVKKTILSRRLQRRLKWASFRPRQPSGRQWLWAMGAGGIVLGCSWGRGLS